MHCSVFDYGEVPERPKGTDCKSVGAAFVGSNPTLTTSLRIIYARIKNYEELNKDSYRPIFHTRALYETP